VALGKKLFLLPRNCPDGRCAELPESREKAIEVMKLLSILLVLIAAVGMASIALARDYQDLVAEGYRWVSLDGPYACPTKEDLRGITSEPIDINELHIRFYLSETLAKYMLYIKWCWSIDFFSPADAGISAPSNSFALVNTNI